MWDNCKCSKVSAIATYTPKILFSTSMLATPLSSKEDIIEFLSMFELQLLCNPVHPFI